jgi:hypothetical protein
MSTFTGVAREMVQVPTALPIGALNGSGPKAPTTNGSRWSKICDWVNAHQKELIYAALIIGMIASASCFGVGLGLGLAGFGGSVACLSASDIVMMGGMMAFCALGLTILGLKADEVI